MRLTIIAVMLSVSSFAQCGRNFDFSFGNFTGWRGDTGNVIVDMNLQTTMTTMNYSGIVNGWSYWDNNHQITSGNQYDWNTCYQVPYVCPWGGPYSARLGNGSMNCHTEDIYYTYRVDPNNPILVYAFAPVLMDPNHPDYAQPAFISYAKDSTGAVIPCTYYRVTATNLRGQLLCQQPGYTNVYRNWENVAVDLSAYAGRNITVYFQTVDCGFCGHYGYAYLDIIGCYPKMITLDCNPNGTLLTAPPGFERYQWSTGQSTQSIIVGPNNWLVTCTITSVTGCRITLTARAVWPCPCPSLSMITHN